MHVRTRNYMVFKNTLVYFSVPNRSAGQEFRREGWTETAIILCKLNKSL